MAAAPRVGFVSLGCPKALVDSERILTQLRAEGYEIAPSYDGADLVVVNTCGFIDDAVHESLDSIGEALRENGRVLVTGCLGAQPEKIRERHPSVLGITGPHAYEDVLKVVHEHLPKPHDPYADLVPPQGIRLTPRHYAYMKISEGCNHRCSFCIIPSMRGDLVSRPIPLVLNEGIRLLNAGVKELLVISQDTSAYGVDLRYRPEQWGSREIATRFIDLARELGTLARERDAWVRLHYVYPYPHVDEVIGLMADGLVLPYLDIPFQHGSPRVLKLMKRPAHAENTLARVQAWRRALPDLAIRSTFIVGFPGETAEDVDELCEFVREARFERLGVFRYSQEEGTRAAKMDGQVSPKEKERRWHQVMALQKEIAASVSSQSVGKTLRVLVDEAGVARGEADAPDIDGRVYVPKGLKVGAFASVKISGHHDYDLLALPEGERPASYKVARQAQ